MHETADDLAELQGLLDRSFANAGSHLLSIFDPPRRLDAEQLSEMLKGMRLLNVATVTAKGEPRVGPVDGHFHRGRFYFGSSPESFRFKHIRARPAVSAAHTVGEQIAVVVHGTATIIDVMSPEQDSFRAQLMETYGKDPAFAAYLEKHGVDWDDWFSDALYARIDAEKMFTFHSSSPTES
ncbi:MAG TPA: pyridoxamine 5'-phosphate oxidase family protein [Actinomycetota bacterium]|nr:pyridoxamine 5'-phosphate oxidase family protein [Actinomycetota bacterium]